VSDAWYNEIALRNGGYKSKAKYIRTGISGEDIFEEKLFKMLNSNSVVLDAGCGDGEFTLKVSKLVKQITGFDSSIELLKVAQRLKSKAKAENCDFVFCSTKEYMPFADEQFDLIYSRRGPTSILHHPRLLKKGGSILGIHSAAFDKVKDRLVNHGFSDIKFEEFNDAYLIFDDEDDFCEFMSSFPGNPNYHLAENKGEFASIKNEYKKAGKYIFKEWRYIWEAKRI
jgi:SAM-dependent methyltransferase